MTRRLQAVPPLADVPEWVPSSIAALNRHPLGSTIHAAFLGFWPPVDGVWTRLPQWRPDVSAVVAFTGHAVICAPSDLTDPDLNELGADGIGGAHHPGLAMALLGESGVVHPLDILMLASGTVATAYNGIPRLVRRPDLDDHPRVEFARSLRDGVHAFGLADSDDVVVALGTGIGGLSEIGFEVAPGARNKGLARQALQAATTLVPEGLPLVASVAPGNVASVRVLLDSYFEIVGSHQLITHEPR